MLSYLNVSSDWFVGSDWLLVLQVVGDRYSQQVLDTMTFKAKEAYSPIEVDVKEN